ncbi:MAG: hypothetical protein LBF26_03445 [Puniceicoccales bacterium]|jgi:hypothetical protein|nr:hypothetical protein [Puniceicoccales bacterium]
MTLQPITSNVAPLSGIHEEKTFSQLMACRTQIPTFAIVADIGILVFAIFIIPYLIYIIYCVIADHSHHLPVVFLWRNMRRELAAAHGNTTEPDTPGQIAPVPKTEQKTLDKPEEFEALNDALARPIAVVKLPPTGYTPPADVKDIKKKFTSFNYDDQFARIYRLPPWPDIPPPSSDPASPTLPPDIARLSTMLRCEEELRLLTPERRKWEEQEIAKARHLRQQLDEFISSGRLRPCVRKPESQSFGTTASDPSPDPTPPTKRQLPDNVYISEDGTEVTMPNFKKICVSTAGNQCTWRSLAQLLLGEEKKFPEIKQEVYKFLMLYLGHDPDQFDRVQFQKQIDCLSDLLARKSGAEVRCAAVFRENFSQIKIFVPVVIRFLALYMQLDPQSEDADKDDVTDNRAYASFIGFDPNFDEIARQLYLVVGNLYAFWGRTTWCDDGNLSFFLEKIGDMFTDVFKPPIMPSELRRISTNAQGIPYPLRCVSSSYMDSLFASAVALHNNDVVCASEPVFRIVAYLYNCEINVWDHDKDPHTLIVYHPDDFKIPEIHPKYAELVSVRHPFRNLPINIWDKRLVLSIGHCWALVEQD